MITKGKCHRCGARVKVFNYGDSQRLHDKSLELCGVCRAVARFRKERAK